MKAGTLIELPDGRRGVVVYNGLDGYGVRLGKESLTAEEMEIVMDGTAMAHLFGQDPPEEALSLVPNAMLRNPYPSADCECVGTEYQVIK